MHYFFIVAYEFISTGENGRKRILEYQTGLSAVFTGARQSHLTPPGNSLIMAARGKTFCDKTKRKV